MTADPNRMNGIAVDFIRTDKGVIKPVYANAIAFLRAHAHEIGLKFDTFSMRPFRGNGFLMEADLRHIAEIVQRSGVLASKNVIDDAVLRVCEERMFHQVAEYLNALAWDGISRISRILIDHAGAPDTELVQAQTGKWMIQAVARIFEPGCQADATLVLEGEQGLGKSTFFFDMFGAKWFTDHLPDLHNKDAMMQLRGAWCVEIAELATFTRTDAKKINQFLTTKIDRYRDPYGRLVQDFPRQTVFAGTVNPGAMGYLKDETGALAAYREMIAGTQHLGSADQFYAVQGIARILTKRGEFEEALATLRKVDLDKQGGFWRGSLLLSVGDTQQAAGRKDAATATYQLILGDQSVDARSRKAAEDKLKSIKAP